MNRKTFFGILFFPVLFMFMEAMLHLDTFESIDTGLLLAILFAVPYGLLAYVLTSFKNRIADRILLILITLITVLYFSLQTVYHKIFRVFVSFYSVLQNTGDVAEFWKEAVHGIISSIPMLMLVMVFPLTAVILMCHFGLIGISPDGTGNSERKRSRKSAPPVKASADTAAGSEKNNPENNNDASVVPGEHTALPGPEESKDMQVIVARKSQEQAFLTAYGSREAVKHGIPAIVLRLILFFTATALYAGIFFSLGLFGKEVGSAYDLYHNYFVLDLGIENLGALTSAGLDIKQLIPAFGPSEEDFGSDFDLTVPTGTPVPSVIPTPTPAPTAPPEATPTPTPTPAPTPTPIDTSPNVLNIDFSALASGEKDKEIRKLHEYFAEAAPTNRNQYTGMFKGYNFIYLTCEAFCPWAVDETHTPTLYKLTHSGFVFTNFYNPIWYTSTSDGEYVECMGLLPYNTNSFKRSKTNALPFCFGWQFLKLGYTSRAYHDHTATYYGRNETHPNMGYIFKAKYAGLPITDVWPESDLEMMQLTLPEYINDEHFHTYYMTVSGHLEYGFNDNTMARRNKDLVADLPYSEEVRAYIACNIELDKALEYLIDELDKAGKLDNTVIAFGGDHYPYGLTDEGIDEAAGHKVERNFELYENYFVLWNSQIKEPIVIDKYCSSLDMMPTISNLFGLEYDSRLFMGSDILSDAPALVIFGNQSFITDLCMYNSKTREVTMLTDAELPEDYIKNVSKIVQNKFALSKSILLNDYYRYILDYIPNVVTKVPDSYGDSGEQ